MFRKNKTASTPPLTYIWLSFNISAMERWLESKHTINPISEWDDSDKTIKHLITLLPQDPFLFYHDDKRQFSPGIGGYEYPDIKVINSIEWRWNQEYFFVSITDETIPVFFAPLSEIFHFLQNKSPSSLTDHDIEIQIQDNYCKKVHQYPVFGTGVGFKNELVDISFVCANADNLVQY
ncbi:MAG TPA: hypothetical protein VIM41_06790 [Gammaproteobacteria bacterium]